MLDPNNAIPYLLEHRLIDRDWIIDGELVVRSAARRNRNLWVEGPGGAGYLIKQPDPLARDGLRTLRNEAAFYDFCRDEPAMDAVTRLLPRMVHRDAGRPLHALELIVGATPLATFHGAQDPEAFPLGPSRALGEALARVHCVFRVPGLADDPRLRWLCRPTPGVFGIHRPPLERIAGMSPAAAQVLRVVQGEDGLGDLLERLGERWRIETLIHGDVKSDNVLVRYTPDEEPGRPGRAEIWLVDWEFVQFGDPAWDVAGALHDALIFWTSSMPLLPTLLPDEMIARARYPLDLQRGAVRAFWEGYLSTAGLGPAEADDLLSRAVEFSAARLILAAYEMSAEATEISVQAVLLLQLAANLLADPALGRFQLYGLFSDLVQR